jgi:hypothetical protein
VIQPASWAAAQQGWHGTSLLQKFHFNLPLKLQASGNERAYKQRNAIERMYCHSIRSVRENFATVIAIAAIVLWWT